MGLFDDYNKLNTNSGSLFDTYNGLKSGKIKPVVTVQPTATLPVRNLALSAKTTGATANSQHMNTPEYKAMISKDIITPKTQNAVNIAKGTAANYLNGALGSKTGGIADNLPIPQTAKNVLNFIGDSAGTAVKNLFPILNIAEPVVNNAGNTVREGISGAAGAVSGGKVGLGSSVVSGNGDYGGQQLISDLGLSNWVKQHPILSGGAGILTDIATDPSTYIGGAGIEKALAKGSASVGDEVGSKVLNEIISNPNMREKLAQVAEQKAIQSANKLIPKTPENVVSAVRPAVTVKAPITAEQAARDFQYNQMAKDNSKNLLGMNHFQSENTLAKMPAESPTSPKLSTPLNGGAKVDGVVQGAENATEIAPKSLGADIPHPGRVELEEYKTFPNGLPVSEFRTNTIAHSTEIPDDVKAMLDTSDFKYTPESAKEWAAQAEYNLQKDPEEVFKRLQSGQSLAGGVEAYERHDISTALLKQAKQTGDYSQYKSFLQDTAAKTRETARGLAATGTAWDKSTPEGMMQVAQHSINNVEDDILKKSPKVKQAVEDETEAVVKGAKQARENAANDVVKEVENGKIYTPEQVKAEPLAPQNVPKVSETSSKVAIPKLPKEIPPEQMLAKRIENAVQPKTVEEKTMIQKMVDELYGTAKESPIESQTDVLKPSALSKVSDAIKYRNQYVSTWNKAKDIVKAEFKDNPQATEILNNYFDKGIKPPYSLKSFNSAFNQGMKDRGLNMAQIVKEYYAHGSDDKQGLINALIRQSGLSGDDARSLANSIDNRFRELKKQYAEKYLAQTFAEKAAKTTKGALVNNRLKGIEALSNTGAFVNENFKNKVLGKLAPKLRQLVKDVGINMDDLVRQGYGKTELEKTRFVNDLSKVLNVNERDLKTILQSALDEFNGMAESKRAQILNKMLVPKTRTAQQKTLLDKVVELINLGAYDKSQYRDLIKQKYNLPILEDSDIKSIVDNMEKFQNEADPKLASKYKEAAVQVIANKMPVTWGDKINAIRYVNMLANPKTHLRNIIGNAVSDLARRTKNVVGILPEKILPKVERTKAIITPFDKTTTNFAKSDFDKMADELRNTSKLDYNQIKAKAPVFVSKNKVLNTALKPLEAIRKFNNWALDAEDMWSLKRAYIDSLSQAIKARGLNPSELAGAPLGSVRQYATNEALKATFHDASTLAQTLNQLENKNNITKVLVGGLMPFKKTPINILKRGASYSPLGLIKSLSYDVGKLAKGSINGAQFVDNVSRGLTGTGVAVLGGFLASKGLVNVSQEETGKSSDYQTMEGYQPYSIQVGNRSYTVDWLTPSSMAFFMGAQYYNQISNKGKVSPLQGFSRFCESMTNVTDPLFNLSMMSGVNSFLKSAGQGAGNAALNGAVKVGQNYLTQFAPTLGSQIAKTITPTQKSTYIPNAGSLPKPIAQVGAQLMGKTPGLNSLLPNKIDLWGRTVSNGKTLGSRAVSNFLSPGYYSESNSTPVDKEVQRLYKATSNSEALPTSAPKTVNGADGKTYYMTSAEQSRYQQTMGQAAFRGLRKTINDVGYKKLPDTQLGNTNDKTSMVSQVYKDAQEIAKQEFFKNRGIKYTTAKEKETNVQKAQGRLGKNIYKRIGNYTK